MFPANTIHRPNFGPMLGHCLGLRPSIGPTSGRFAVFAGKNPSKWSSSSVDVYWTSFGSVLRQRSRYWPNLEPALKQCCGDGNESNRLSLETYAPIPLARRPRTAVTASCIIQRGMGGPALWALFVARYLQLSHRVARQES